MAATRRSPADGSGPVPLEPAIHLAPSSGWMNDPNGLCLDQGVWHAFYQHDPDTDVHGVMHWGHATSSDLVRWTHHPIALEPDELGVIYSGSVVVDDDDTAGFGHGAMVAVFTHHTDEAERQSLAYSTDHGMSWQKYAGNPVLESTERDFRDPKVRRHVADGRAWWVMVLAVGRRVEFHRSTDLRRWEVTGSYEDQLSVAGAWECPDLLRIPRPGQPDLWLLTFGVFDGGPHGHSGTFAVPGSFDGVSFSPSGPPTPADHGPDFYAAQSFSGTPADTTVQMAWLDSWRYAQAHPSSGRRGVLSFPRRVEARVMGGQDVVTARPAVDLASRGVPIDGTAWASEPGRALHIEATGDVEVVIRADAAAVATLQIGEAELVLHRHDDVVDGYAQTYRAPITGDGGHQVVIDHGTLEAFAAGGGTTMSALVFPGATWTVDADGPVKLTLL